MADLRPLLAALDAGRLHRFRDWPNLEVPAVAAGTYTIWDDGRLLYAGMAGRSLTADLVESHRAAATVRTGLRSRLHSHASGRRSGDQLCLYVCDLLVLPALEPATIRAIAARSVKLDDLVRDYVRDRLSYRYVETLDGTTARQLEDTVRRGGLASGPPLLNPVRPR